MTLSIRSRLTLLIKVNKSVLTTEKKRHKRHIVTATLRNLLAVKVHCANLHDSKAGIFVAMVACSRYSTIQAFCADGGYRGSFVDKVQSILDLPIDISLKIKTAGFHVIPKRRVVEKTFAGLGNSRRLAKDFELTTDSSAEAMIKISHFHTSYIDQTLVKIFFKILG